MPISRSNLFGSPNIGVYALTTNECTILPPRTSKRKIAGFKKYLEGEVVCTDIGGTKLIGVLAAANSKGMVLPHFVNDAEIEAIKSVWAANVERVDCRVTAFGNLILVNDHGAIVGETLARERDAVRRIEDVLGVELVLGEVAGLPYVGSLAVATNRGVLTHPMLREEERKLMEDILKAPVDVGTVNRGSPFVASGILANDNGVIIGGLTTGPEIIMITNVFGG